MSDKRDSKRFGKRFRLKFGKENPDRLAYTEDISTSGLFIKSANIYQPGNVIKIRLDLPDGKEVGLKGRIMWAKKVPPLMMQRIRKSGMGVRILKIDSGAEVYRRMYEELFEKGQKS